MTDDQQRAREMLPCPFCGSADSEMQQAQAEHYVQCLECEASTALFSSRREARELWNRRAALRAAPEGFVLVPAEPTEAMIIAGVSSFPSRPFTPLEEWEIYQEMSGCEQAAYRAKKCWAAMLAARPQGV